MKTMTTKAGPRLNAILDGKPFHEMYEESKKTGLVLAKNLNPLLRHELSGAETPYPRFPRAKCDVVFRHDGEQFWIETKLVQTHYGGNQENWRFEDRNGMFSKHLGLKESDHHSAVRDVRDRLPTLDGLSVADRIGFLMVAYFSPRYPLDSHIREFERIGNLQTWYRDVLIEQPDPRTRAQAERARISVYYWERRTQTM